MKQRLDQTTCMLYDHLQVVSKPREKHYENLAEYMYFASNQDLYLVPFPNWVQNPKTSYTCICISVFELFKI